MAPLARTLALLAMAVATVAMEVWPLDMARSSFDDQYLKCSDSMTKSLPELQSSDFDKNSEFAKNWTKATEEWEKLGLVSSPLTPDQAIALMVHTMDSDLYSQFNEAVHEAGNSSRKYRDEFHFKSLHFLLTRALQTLRRPNDCRDVFLGLRGAQVEVKKGDQIRFGIFVPMFLSEAVAWNFGRDTKFKVHTCHGAEVQKFSKHPEQEHVLIPPFETFNVTAVSKKGNTTLIELRSNGTFSNYDCEWLKGGSLPRNSPHLWGLLLVTMAMAVVSGTL